MTTRIYCITDKANGNPRLVQAGHRAQALSYIAQRELRVRVATQGDIVNAMSTGAEIENARLDPNTKSIFGAPVAS